LSAGIAEKDRPGPACPVLFRVSFPVSIPNSELNTEKVPVTSGTPKKRQTRGRASHLPSHVQSYSAYYRLLKRTRHKHSSRRTPVNIPGLPLCRLWNDLLKRSSRFGRLGLVRVAAGISVPAALFVLRNPPRGRCGSHDRMTGSPGKDTKRAKVCNTVCTEHLQCLCREKWVISASYEPIPPPARMRGRNRHRADWAAL
jgi:hypothetical protein